MFWWFTNIPINNLTNQPKTEHKDTTKTLNLKLSKTTTQRFPQSLLEKTRILKRVL